MVYIANHPNAVDKNVRDVVLNIALNNAMASDDDKMHKVSRHSVPFTCSIVMKYWFNERWGIESGISYTALSSEFDLGTNGNIINECQRLHYIGIPIKGLFNIYNVGVWSVYVTTGITMDIPVYARQRTNYILNGMTKATEETPVSAPWQFSTSLGIGVQYRLTPHIGLFAEPGMQYFIPGSTSVSTFRTEHPVVFSLPVGIRVTW
ncbi:MAG: outer membrane beta-barrel protein [Bacteroidaceae bacterium]|nr:outer membrane beta-barrel protein [Bacteroidaceae bacterium]